MPAAAANSTYLATGGSRNLETKRIWSQQSQLYSQLPNYQYFKKSIILTDTQKTDRIKTRNRQFLPDKCANKVKGDKSKWPTHNFSVKLDVLCHLLSLDHEEIPRRQAFWIFKFSVQQTHADTFSCILVTSSMQSSKKIHRRSFTQI